MKKNFLYGIILAVCGFGILIILHLMLHANEWMLDVFSGLCIVGAGVFLGSKKKQTC